MVCYCFGVTREQIADELMRTGACKLPSQIYEAIRDGRCDCERLNPAGRCCLGELNRVIAELKRSRS